MHQRFFTIVLVVFLSACVSTRTPIIPPVDTSFRVQINKQFDSLPNYTRIYFQDGMRVTYQALDRGFTYCRLHVYNPHKKADYLASVTPDSFGIAKVGMYYESSWYSLTGSGIYASVGTGLSSFNSSFGFYRQPHDPPSYYLYRVEMKLTSPDQPDVQTLICYRKWATRGNFYPRLDGIRRALGDIIEIIPPSISSSG